ncbi:hypothetical protein ACFQET_01880 [Levilactobacillus tangyuanensis]|uniref:Zinc ribbon domain-containing protein n=1 Tax=Levilactobacillus tangyuanensis TaxID=2486021 RepID=A0ABW1TK68_9LACO|nr:hypothetical protein [Levilactobacillus tangyuanensis]
MTCSNCGATLVPGLDHCQNCGARLVNGPVGNTADFGDGMGLPLLVVFGIALFFPAMVYNPLAIHFINQRQMFNIRDRARKLIFWTSWLYSAWTIYVLIICGGMMDQLTKHRADQLGTISVYLGLAIGLVMAIEAITRGISERSVRVTLGHLVAIYFFFVWAAVSLFWVTQIFIAFAPYGGFN